MLLKLAKDVALQHRLQLKTALSSTPLLGVELLRGAGDGDTALALLFLSVHEERLGGWSLRGGGVKVEQYSVGRSSRRPLPPTTPPHSINSKMRKNI